MHTSLSLSFTEPDASPSTKASLPDLKKVVAHSDRAPAHMGTLGAVALQLCSSAQRTWLIHHHEAAIPLVVLVIITALAGLVATKELPGPCLQGTPTAWKAHTGC
ncbi:hypothetical protein P7K49_033492 [Saguinus oedipus]|uniref:Uncharacterized protein n=1 Tax=Saguinus oedipus TaxID=9490 RepID=A0ABQ9TSU4_SAGOE|nr:hypothetical protein P7K49_033492 [Saguinus oedipus]